LEERSGDRDSELAQGKEFWRTLKISNTRKQGLEVWFKV
jgi:hypothetical protein